MSLGQNLQFLRKRDNITQEQLAEALEVSRQSVSKWESDASYPEMDKLIQLANLFHCSLDDLVQKDISSRYVEDKNHYDRFKNQFSKRITAGVGLILSGLTVMLFLQAVLPKSQKFDVEALSGIGFLLFIVVAVAIFIIAGLQNEYYEKKHPYIENFYTDAEKEAFHKKYILWIALGVVLIFVALIITLGSEAVISPNHAIYNKVDVDELLGSVFFFFITIAVTLFVYAGTQESKYDISRYNLLHDHNSKTYKNGKKIGIICACLMMTATIIYLCFGFIGGHWEYAGVIYAVFGIGCGITAIVINRNNEEE